MKTNNKDISVIPSGDYCATNSEYHEQECGINIDKILPSCIRCGCRLDDKENIIYVYNNKAINICRLCYTKLKELN